MDEKLTLRERMSDKDKALYCRMLSRKNPDDLPDALFEAHFRVAMLTNKVDALIRPGTMALIALGVGFDPDTLKFDGCPRGYLAEAREQDENIKPDTKPGEEMETASNAWPEDAYIKGHKVQFFAEGSVLAGKVETAKQTEAGIQYGVKIKGVKELRILQPGEIVKEE